jgi:hypothetical protein
MNILENLQGSLSGFRPKNSQEFVAFQLARRFDDLQRLPRYLLAAHRHPKAVLLNAAKTAQLRYQLNRTPMADLFFEILAEREEGASR